MVGVFNSFLKVIAISSILDHMRPDHNGCYLLALMSDFEGKTDCVLEKKNRTHANYASITHLRYTFLPQSLGEARA